MHCIPDSQTVCAAASGSHPSLLTGILVIVVLLSIVMALGFAACRAARN